MEVKKKEKEKEDHINDKESANSEKETNSRPIIGTYTQQNMGISDKLENQQFKTKDDNAQKLDEVEGYKKCKPKKPEYSYVSNQISSTNEEKKIGYVISQKWMKSWKKFVNYPKKNYYYYNYSQSTQEGIPQLPFPREINGDMLMTVGPEMLLTNDPNDPENHPVFPEYLNRINYRILDAERWKYLYSKYGGITIQREGTKFSILRIIMNMKLPSKFVLFSFFLKLIFWIKQNGLTVEKLQYQRKKPFKT